MISRETKQVSQRGNYKLTIREWAAVWKLWLVQFVSFQSRNLTTKRTGCLACTHLSTGTVTGQKVYLRRHIYCQRGINRWHFVSVSYHNSPVYTSFFIFFVFSICVADVCIYVTCISTILDVLIFWEAVVHIAHFYWYNWRARNAYILWVAVCSVMVHRFL